MSFITNGLNLDSVNQLGGIKGMWILGGTVTSYGPYNDAPAYLNPSQGATSLGPSSIGGTGTWYYFAVPRDASKYDETTTVNQDNGSLFYNGTFTTEFQHSDLTKEITLQTLSQNRYLKLIFLDYQGNYFAAGFDRGATVKDIKKSTGQKPGDAYSYKVTFETNEINPAYQFTADITSVVRNTSSGGFTVQACNNW